jgi:hypothetical protein
MRMKYYSVILLGLLVGLVSDIRGEKGGGKDVTSKPPPVPDFTKLDDRPASDAADAIVVDRQTLERGLRWQLDAGGTPEKRKVLLIYALGQIRSDWAVPSLVKIVDFEAPFTDPKLSLARWGPYPVVDALTAIGDPAVRRIVNILPSEKKDLRVHLLLTVIWQVDGEKLGRARLENAIVAAHDDATKNSLQSALKAFMTLASHLR